MMKMLPVAVAKIILNSLIRAYKILLLIQFGTVNFFVLST